jgi:hypothetical protein
MVLARVRLLRTISGEECAATIEVAKSLPFREKRQGLVCLDLGPATRTPATVLIPRLVAFVAHAEPAIEW